MQLIGRERLRASSLMIRQQVTTIALYAAAAGFCLRQGNFYRWLSGQNWERAKIAVANACHESSRRKRNRIDCIMNGNLEHSNAPGRTDLPCILPVSHLGLGLLRTTPLPSLHSQAVLSDHSANPAPL